MSLLTKPVDLMAARLRARGIDPLLPFLGAASLALLAGALSFQVLGGLEPCVLCLQQRWPHLGVVVAAGALTALGPSRRVQGWGLLLITVLLLVTGGIGLYHVGVEQGWVEASAACTMSTAQGGGAQDLAALRAAIAGAPRAACTDIVWSLLGISMAGWNALLSILLAGIAAGGARRIFRHG
ncbi:disulfide bond formation protein B [Tistrella mobilis]|uniref:Disulfide bond formation protein, DsbB family n=1 Tax=Tistrella mobilis (strain KA081020-065) TaxID=1110502 RepID=I3TQI0_TISMK|nr:disulfide bond formation protein B [Tistrella mobilis]AFK55018.1 disulfide bond formation protein, DsbB family [Tistrella mobilis KA081020-065]